MELKNIIRSISRKRKKPLKEISEDMGKHWSFLATSLNNNNSMQISTLIDVLQAIGACELIIKDRATGDEYVVNKPKKTSDLIGGERVADKPTKADDLIG